jgi:ClpP class serine protease
MFGNIGQVFWIFMMLVMLQPWLRQRLLVSSRARMMHRIEQQRGSRLILLVHRQESISILGLPFYRYIDMDDAEAVIRAIQLTDPELPIDLVLHTPGGLVLASLQIARAVKARRGKVTVFVPHYAMSGGTLIALAAQEIVMDAHAVLGPVDPQLGEYPAASLVKAVKTKSAADLDDKTLIMADVAEKALAQMRAEVSELLSDRMPPERVKELTDKLSQGTWTHDHPIGLQEAKGLGLPARDEMPQEFYQLMALYEQPVRQQRAVEYIPVPYGPPTRPGGQGKG